MIGVLALVFLGAFGLVVGAAAFLDRERLGAARAARARLLPHVPRATRESAQGLLRGAGRLSGFGALERFLLETEAGRALADRAAVAVRAAGGRWSVGEYLLATALGAATGVLLGLLLGSVVLVLVAGAAGASVPRLALARLAARRRALFDQQLPAALETIADSLRAGYSFPAALEFATTEAEEPLGAELARLRDEQRLGIEVREALAAFADRVGTEDARMFVSAVLIQRETGGNLADLLANLAALVRERQTFKLRVAALTAEPRMSALVLALLPVGVLLLLSSMNFAYVRPLLVTPMGHAILAVATLLTVVGYLVMRRIGDVEL